MAEETSPLDAALAGIEREQLGGDDAGASSPPDPGSQTAPDPGSTESEAPFIPPPPRKARGRPRKTDGRRSHAKKPPASSATAPRIQDPPAPDVGPEYPAIPLASVASSIKQIDAIIVKMAGTTPLTDPEADGGAAVFAPVLDHYMPLLAEKGALWLAPLTWTILAYGPRAYEVLDRRQRRIDAEKRGVPLVDDRERGASENGRASFRDDAPASVALDRA